MSELKVSITAFKDEFAAYFTNLNLAWLKKYFVVEPIDHEMLSDPKKYIIEKGGYIFFAKVEETIAGTFAFIKIDDETFELSKMAVDEAFQGNKIGNTMLEFCLKEAKRLKANRIILYSNTKLFPAIHLYRKYGFKEVPLENSEYVRSDIKMEIDLNSINEQN